MDTASALGGRGRLLYSDNLFSRLVAGVVVHAYKAFYSCHTDMRGCHGREVSARCWYLAKRHLISSDVYVALCQREMGAQVFARPYPKGLLYREASCV